MKPLLIIPPSRSRWPGVESLLDFVESARLDDIRRRVCDGCPPGHDALAVVPSGSLVLAFACIRRRDDVGVLGDLFTRPDHRRRGLARSLLQTLLSWFDMTGGKRLYLTTTTDLAIAIFENFGFQPLHHSPREPHAAVTMLRTPFDAPRDPYPGLQGEIDVGDASRADYAGMVELHQRHVGPDPRVALAESAVAAESAVIELLAQQDRGACRLIRAVRGGVITGLASLATDQLGKRTFAVIVPHTHAPPVLREALTVLAQSRGYEQVEFPLEALAPTA